MLRFILLTDTARYANPQLPCLKKYKNNLCIVKFNSTEYDVDSYAKVVDLSDDKNNFDLSKSGYESWQYLSINNHIKDILNLFKYYGVDFDATILCDADTEGLTNSLYLMDVLQKFEFSRDINFILPVSLDNIKRNSIQAELLSDLSKVKTLAVYDPYKLSLEKYGNTEPENIEKIINERTEYLFKRYYDLSRKMIYQGDSRKYFFDFEKDSFIDTDSLFILDDYIIYSTLGLMIDPYILDEKKEENDYFINCMQIPPPRLDGKKVCEKLREIRKNFAKLNGLEYNFKECNYSGCCGGTCKACDNEARTLAEMAKQLDEIKYPQVSLEEFI